MCKTELQFEEISTAWWWEMLSYSSVQIPTLYLLVVWLLETAIKSYMILVPEYIYNVMSCLIPLHYFNFTSTLKASSLICGQDKHAPTSGPLRMLPLPR